MTRRALFILILGCLACPLRGAEPPARPADVWLDRAIAELPGVRRESEATKGKPDIFERMLAEEAIALPIFQCRPDKAGRALIIEIARRAEKAAPLEKTPTAQFGKLNAAATLFAYAGVKEDALRLLPALEKAKVESDYFTAMSAAVSIAVIRERIGELNEPELEKLSLLSLRVLMERAAEEDRGDDFAKYFRFARKTVESAHPKDSIELMLLAESAAKCGQIAAANEIAAEIPNTDRVDALTRIAWVRHRRGDQAGCLQNLQEALRSASVAKTNRLGAFESVLDAAIETHDRSVMSLSADSCWAELTQGGFGQPFETPYLVRIATAYSLAGRSADFEKSITAAQAGIAKIPRKEQPAYEIQIATAFARAGDKNRADAAVANAQALGKLRDEDKYEFESLSDAYAKAGDFEMALSTLKSHVPDRQDQIYPLQLIAWHQIRAGHYADAESTAMLVQDRFRRFTIHYWIATQKAKAGELDKLPVWIASHATARQRAGLYLAVAQQLLGREGMGYSRILTPPD